MSQLTEYPDFEMLAIDVANHLAGELRMQLDHEDRVLFVVPGGTTPGPIFDDLSCTDLDWARIDVMPSDERWVPEDHARSNARLIRERLLQGRAAAARFLPISEAAETPEAVIESLSARVADHLPIGVCLLGMGADMHVASLFPGADRLEEALAAHAPPLMAMRAPGAEEPRVTLTAHVLNDAMAKHVVIRGEDKRAAYERALHAETSEAPVRAILSGATVHWAPDD